MRIHFGDQMIVEFEKHVESGQFEKDVENEIEREEKEKQEQELARCEEE